MATDGVVEFKVEIDSKDAKKSMTGLNKTATKAAKGVVVGILAIGGASLKAAADMEATNAKFDTVFGSMSNDMDGFLDEWNNITGATQAGSRSMASGIQDLLIPMGFMRDEATDMTKDTLNLVGALANFNSATHSAEDVAGAFQSALTGSTEPLKALGIQINKAKIAQKAFDLGLIDTNVDLKALEKAEVNVEKAQQKYNKAVEKSGKDSLEARDAMVKLNSANEKLEEAAEGVTGELSEQATAQAILALANEQSGDALSAFNEESLDAKTKMEIAKNQLIDAAAVLGEQLLPLLTLGAEKLSEFATWIAQNSELVTKIVVVLGSLAAVVLIINAAMAAYSAVAAVAAVATSAVLLPILLVIAGIALLVTAIVLIAKNWDMLKEKGAEFGKSIAETFDKVKDGIVTTFQSVVDFIREGIEKIKNFFKFKISLPKIKLPHFSVSGKFSIIPPRVPKIGVKWFAKGGVMTKPTIFAPGMGGGEAGPEAIAPISVLQDFIGDAVRGNMSHGQTVVMVQQPATTLEIDGATIAQAIAPHTNELVLAGGGNR